jgi:hypothetical protein
MKTTKYIHIISHFTKPHLFYKNYMTLHIIHNIFLLYVHNIFLIISAITRKYILLLTYAHNLCLNPYNRGSYAILIITRICPITTEITFKIPSFEIYTLICMLFLYPLVTYLILNLGNYIYLYLEKTGDYLCKKKLTFGQQLGSLLILDSFVMSILLFILLHTVFLVIRLFLTEIPMDFELSSADILTQDSDLESINCSNDIQENCNQNKPKQKQKEEELIIFHPIIGFLSSFIIEAIIKLYILPKIWPSNNQPPPPPPPAAPPIPPQNNDPEGGS